MKSWHLLIAASVLFFVPTSCATIEAAMVTVSIDGESATAPLTMIPKSNERGHTFLIGESDDEAFEFETSNGTIILGGMLDPDPSIIFVGAAIDAGTPSNFSFSFILPLAPLSNAGFVQDSFSGSVTNGGGPDVVVTALAPPAGIPVDGDGVTEMQVFTLSNDGGLTWQNVGLDLGPSATVPLPVFFSGAYGNFNEGPIATIPGGPWTHMRADVNFRLSGGNDIFSFNGAKVLVPEPGTLILALFSSGVFFFSGPLSLRRRTA